MVSRAASGAAVGTVNSSSSPCAGCAGEPGGSPGCGSVCAAGIPHALAAPEPTPEGLQCAESSEQPRAAQS